MGNADYCMCLLCQIVDWIYQSTKQTRWHAKKRDLLYYTGASTVSFPKPSNKTMKENQLIDMPASISFLTHYLIFNSIWSLTTLLVSHMQWVCNCFLCKWFWFGITTYWKLKREQSMFFVFASRMNFNLLISLIRNLVIWSKYYLKPT